MGVSVEEEEAGQWALKCKAVSPRRAFRILRLEVLDAAIQLVLSRVSRVRLSVVLWTAAHQAPLSMRILQARILEWVSMPSPPRDLPDPRIEPRPPTLLAVSLPLSHRGSPFFIYLHPNLEP